MRRSQAPSLLRLPGPNERPKPGNSQNVNNASSRRPASGDLEYSVQKFQRRVDMDDKPCRSHENIHSVANSGKGSSLIKSPSLMSISQASVVSDSSASIARSKPIESKKLDTPSSIPLATSVRKLDREIGASGSCESTKLKLTEKVDVKKEENHSVSVQNHASKDRTSIETVIEEIKPNAKDQSGESRKLHDMTLLTSTEQVDDSTETKINLINLSLVLCKPTQEQKLSIETIVSAADTADFKVDAIKKVLLHPGTISNISSENWDGRESAKIATLIKILHSFEPNKRLLIVVAAEETKVSLDVFFGNHQRLMQGDAAKRIKICCSTEISSSSEQFDLLVAFDIFPKHFISLFGQFLKHLTEANFVQLITQGTVEELFFWSNVVDEAGVEFTEADLRVSTSSFIRDRLVSRSRKFAGAVDDEFSELWPKLLDCDWHAEAGGGLVDYHYCLPGYTSKSAKGKIKGQKNVHFFTSKMKVLDYLRKNIDSKRRISLFELGAFDLTLWDFELVSSTSTSKNALFTKLTDVEVHSVYSFQQRTCDV